MDRWSSCNKLWIEYDQPSRIIRVQSMALHSDAEEMAEKRHAPVYSLIRRFHSLAGAVNPSSGCDVIQLRHFRVGVGWEWWRGWWMRGLSLWIEARYAPRAWPDVLIRCLWKPSFSVTSMVCAITAFESSFECFNAVFALKMTFDPISYVYLPTAPRPKNTKSGLKAITYVDTSSKKNERIRPSATTLDTVQLPVAGDADRDGDRDSRM